MAEVIRLHVRAADDSPQEQKLKLEVRNEILALTEVLLKDCEAPAQAKEILKENLPALEEAGKAAVERAGKTHGVTAELKKEHFEYREYGEFFLPEGEYESLIITVGSGEGQNWWCVVFPSACYLGAADRVETDGMRMPACFRLASERCDEISVRWGIWEWLKGLFGQ